MDKPRHYIPLLAAVILLCGLGFATTGSTEQHRSGPIQLAPIRGIVTFAEGRVEVRSIDGAWQPLYSTDRVRPDDSIRTGDDGRAEISWGNPRRVIRIERSSVVRLRGEARGDRLVLAGASLDDGAIWVRNLDRKRSFELESPAVSADVQEATLSLRISDQESRLAVYQGTVQVGTEEVKAGAGVLVTKQGRTAFEVAAEDDLRDGWRDIVKEALAAEREQPERPQVSKRLSRDLRDLSPDIYLGVEVELTGNETAGRGFEADGARIRKIRVRAEKWDDLLPDHKVRLLNDTFTVLKERYPTILETMVLEFDDHRPRLSLKYAAAG